jgi:hypothetical protein
LVSPSNGTITVSGSGNIDEVRLYPDKALMTTMTYTPLIGITSQCDPNNKILYYYYDDFSRLSLVFDQDNNVIKKICYNYYNQPEDCTSPCINLTPNWQNIGTPTCQQLSCGGNTGYQLQQQQDMNPCSATYNQIQTVSIYNPGVCTPASTNPNWQNTNTPLRCQQGGCGNTGYQEQEQRDMNPCSATYNTTQWVNAGYNPTACPPTNCINLTSTNGLTGYTASYYNTSTAITYNFSVSSTLGLQPLGTVPEGNYTLTISRTQGFPVYCEFRSGCKFQIITGTSATFYNVAVSAISCNSITITAGN